MGTANPLDEFRRRIGHGSAPGAFAALAEEHRRAGRLEEAVAVCRDGLTRYPTYVSARVTLGRALLDLGEVAAATLELEQVVAQAPDNLAAVRALAQARDIRGNVEDDVAHLRGDATGDVSPPAAADTVALAGVFGAAAQPAAVVDNFGWLSPTDGTVEAAGVADAQPASPAPPVSDGASEWDETIYAPVAPLDHWPPTPSAAALPTVVDIAVADGAEDLGDWGAIGAPDAPRGEAGISWDDSLDAVLSEVFDRASAAASDPAVDSAEAIAAGHLDPDAIVAIQDPSRGALDLELDAVAGSLQTLNALLAAIRKRRAALA